MVDGSSRTGSLRSWISSHFAWVLWGAVAGFGLWLTSAYLRFGPHDGPLAGIEASIFRLLVVAAAAVAVLIRLVTLSDARLKKEWPVFVVFPGAAAVAYLAALGITLAVAFLLRSSTN